MFGAAVVAFSLTRWLLAQNLPKSPLRPAKALGGSNTFALEQLAKPDLLLTQQQERSESFSGVWSTDA